MSAPVAVQVPQTSRVGRGGFAIGILIVAVVAAAALVGNALVPQDPFVQDLGNRLVPPFWMEGTQPAHLLGTDQLGRDYLARLVYGARISLLIGIMTVITSGLIGITLGVLGGFFGGHVDDLVPVRERAQQRDRHRPPLQRRRRRPPGGDPRPGELDPGQRLRRRWLILAGCDARCAAGTGRMLLSR